MYLLLIDTGWEFPWVSLMSDDSIVFDLMSSGNEDTGDFLRSTVENLLEQYDRFVPKPLVICVSCGPGRFSALRCGMAFSEGLSFVLNAPILGWRATEVMYAGRYTEKFIAVVTNSGNKLSAVVKQRLSNSMIKDITPETVMEFSEFPEFCLLHSCSKVVVSNTLLKEKIQKLSKNSFCEVDFADRFQLRIYQLFIEQKKDFKKPEIDYGLSYLVTE